MWGDPFCMTAAWTLPTVANARILTYTFSSSNYSCTMCSFHHEVTDKVSWIKVVCIIYVIWNCWRLARKSAAVDQDSTRSYYIIPWLAFNTVFIINVRLNFIAAYKIVVSQNSAEPQAQYSRSSVSITCLMVTVFSLKQWNLQSDNLHADYYSFRSDSDSVSYVLLFHQVSSLCTPCNAVTSDVLMYYIQDISSLFLKH
jgi:hypothetical protein